MKVITAAASHRPYVDYKQFTVLNAIIFLFTIGNFRLVIMAHLISFETKITITRLFLPKSTNN